MLSNKKWTFGVLFSGIGGLTRGFMDAGMEPLYAIDFDPEACADHLLICGFPAICADIAAMTPEQLRALSPRRPDVLLTSPPCQAFSGCLPKATSQTEKYSDMSTLSYSGLELALAAYADDLPALILLENVTGMKKRGKVWLTNVCKMLNRYGYVCKITEHDCGHLGQLAQSRKRVLLVARHKSVPEFLYEPPKHHLRGVGEVFERLPVPTPDSTEGGPMHALPKQSDLNALRLALIAAGKDWRALPKSVITCKLRRGVYGVRGWTQNSTTVIGAARVDNGSYAVADPRSICTRRPGALGVTGWNDHTHAVIGAASPQNTSLQVADPRVELELEDGEDIEQHACDPRLRYQKRRGALHVHAWYNPSHTVIGAANSYHGSNVADPRIEHLDAELRLAHPDIPWIIGPPLDLENPRAVRHVIILAADGTIHRPMTTLELYMLQGFEPYDADGNWMVLTGKSHKRWRQRIGNAVPPPTARAIAASCMRTLDACAADLFLFCGEPVWVSERQEHEAHA